MSGCFIVKYTLMIEDFTALFPSSFQELAAATINYLYLFLPIWLPVVLLLILWNVWIYFIKTKFMVDQEYSLIEVKLPT